MAHASVIAAIGRHGPLYGSVPKDINQHRRHGEVYQHLRPMPCSQNFGVCPGAVLCSESAVSSGAKVQVGLSLRKAIPELQKLNLYSDFKGSPKCRIPAKSRGTVRCHSSSVSAGGSENLETSMEEMALRCAQQRQVQGGQWQGDKPMVLPVLLREKKPEHFVKAAEGLLKMARLQNYFPSFLLVVLGAWMASGHDVSVILMPKVWITAACSALIAVASMLANDVFDFRSGTDQANERDTPLMTGEVAPDDAELAAGCLYGAAVIGICCLEPMTLRLLVGGAAVATYIYTPFLKRLLVVKNVIVAAIIASSILAGGLVAGGAGGVARTGQVSLFFFLCILCREILMDVGDMVGDKAAGVRTVAVCFGRRVGTAAAGIALAAANAVLIGLLSKTQAVAAAGTLLLLPLHAKIFQLLQGGSDFTADRLFVLRGVVDQSMLYIGGSVLLLATIV